MHHTGLHYGKWGHHKRAGNDAVGNVGLVTGPATEIASAKTCAGWWQSWPRSREGESREIRYRSSRCSIQLQAGRWVVYWSVLATCSYNMKASGIAVRPVKALLDEFDRKATGREPT